MKLLICDNTAALGRLLANRLINMGIPSECCRGILSAMQDKLSSSGALSRMTERRLTGIYSEPEVMVVDEVLNLMLSNASARVFSPVRTETMIHFDAHMPP